MSSSHKENAKKSLLQNVDRKILIAVVVIASVTIIGFYAAGSGWTPTSATLQVTIQNETDQEITNLNAQFAVYVSGEFNITHLPSIPANITVEYAYGVTSALLITVHNISRHATISFQVVSIHVPGNLSADLGRNDVYLWSGSPPTGIGCSFLLTVYGNTPFGIRSLGSSYNQWESGINVHTGFTGYDTERYDVHLFYYSLMTLTALILSAVPLARKHENIRERYPFATLIVMWISIFVYVFLGSAWELIAASMLQVSQVLIIDLLLLSLSAFLLFLLTSFLGFIYRKVKRRSASQLGSRSLELVSQGLTIVELGALTFIAAILSLKTATHFSYSHLTGNLFYFPIIGCACEAVAIARRNKTRFTAFFVLPLVAYGFSGFGLSTAIESMAILFAAYAIINHRTIGKSRLEILAVFLSGLTLYVFYGWLEIFLTSGLIGTTLTEAVLHILATVVTFVGVLVFYIIGRFSGFSNVRELFDSIFREGAHKV